MNNDDKKLHWRLMQSRTDHVWVGWVLLQSSLGQI
jgi:hypothetical protein